MGRCWPWPPGRRRSARVTTVLGDKATGPDLVPVLQQTGIAELLYAAGLFAGLTIGAVIASA